MASTNSPSSNTSALPTGRPEGTFSMNRHIPINDLETLDRAHVFHPSTHLAQFARGEAPSRIVTGGEGIIIVDRDGKQSLDALAGLYCVNVGYGRREIADAIHEQAKKLAYYHAYV